MYHKIKSIDTVNDIESIQSRKHFEKYFEFGSMSISVPQIGPFEEETVQLQCPVPEPQSPANSKIRVRFQFWKPHLWKM
ncbi:hypothetical protein CsSME_00015276 [Camellia sinensis var. sinensis]